jgi:hypothetical protein
LRKLHKDELHSLTPVGDIAVIILGSMREIVQFARMKWTESAYSIPNGDKPVWRSTYNMEERIILNAE